MSCDIHAYVEVLKKGAGAWEIVMPTGGNVSPYAPKEDESKVYGDDVGDKADRAEFDLHQWYALFNKIAGVRGPDDGAIVPPRGVPDDASVELMTYYATWSGDAHSATWLTRLELIKIGEELDGASELLEGVVCVMSALEEAGGEARFVCWFDN